MLFLRTNRNSTPLRQYIGGTSVSNTPNSSHPSPQILLQKTSSLINSNSRSAFLWTFLDNFLQNTYKSVQFSVDLCFAEIQRVRFVLSRHFILYLSRLDPNYGVFSIAKGFEILLTHFMSRIVWNDIEGILRHSTSDGNIAIFEY